MLQRIRPFVRSRTTLLWVVHRLAAEHDLASSLVQSLWSLGQYNVARMVRSASLQVQPIFMFAQMVPTVWFSSSRRLFVDQMNTARANNRQPTTNSQPNPPSGCPFSAVAATCESTSGCESHGTSSSCIPRPQTARGEKHRVCHHAVGICCLPQSHRAAPAGLRGRQRHRRN